MSLPKLVRDKIPEIISQSGKDCLTYTASSNELNYFLIEKMKEELAEFKETPCLDEAADVYEVFLVMLQHWKMDLNLVKATAETKRQIKGSFNEGIILEKVF